MTTAFKSLNILVNIYFELKSQMRHLSDLNKKLAPSLKPLAVNALVGLFYALLAYVGMATASGPGVSTFIWPASGFALAAYWLWGKNALPGLLLGEACAGFWSSWQTHGQLNDFYSYLSISLLAGMCGLLLQIWALTWLETKFCTGKKTLANANNVIKFVGIVAPLGCIVNPTFGVLVTAAASHIGLESILKTWATWWLGDTAGVICVTPIVLSIVKPIKLDKLKANFYTVLVTSGLLAAVLWISFSSILPVSIDKVRLFAFAPFPIAIWITYQYGMLGASLATLLVSIASVVGTMQGYGPFATFSGDERLLLLVIYLVAIAITNYVLAGALEERNRANIALSAFLANMSHEIRTPLTAIVGFGELLVNTPKDQPLQRVFTEKILHNGRHLQAIVDNILDLSKIEADQLVVKPARVNPLEEISMVMSMFEPQVRLKKIAMSLRYSNDVPAQINTDSTRFRQILINIIGNAVKFTQRGSIDIWVCLHSAKVKQLKIVIKDTGCGLSRDQQEKIFEPFYQADAAPKIKGTGLGLALSRRLACALGGDLDLEYSYPKIGSVFAIKIATDLMSAISLPMLDNVKAAAKPKRQRKNTTHHSFDCNKLKGLKILLAEDSEDSQLLIRTLLESAGATVEIARNGVEAVEKASRQQYDTVLMDIQMPILNGFEAVSRLRKKGYRAPVVALTAHAFREDFEKCLASGCNDFLTKPVTANALINKVRLICDSPWAKQSSLLGEKPNAPEHLS